jgi:signal transduction histidine kinase
MGLAFIALSAVLISYGVSNTFFGEGRASSTTLILIWVSAGAAVIIGMVVLQSAAREVYVIKVIRWFAGLEDVLGDVQYPLSRGVLYPIGAWFADLFPGHGGWLILIRAPGVLIRGEVLRQQYVRILSEELSGEWSVSWAESFIRDWLDGDAMQNGVFVSLPHESREMRSLMCWMAQSQSKDVAVGIVVALPEDAGRRRRLIPDVMNAALDMVVQRLGSLLAEVINRKSRLNGNEAQDPLLLVRALVHELSGELHGIFIYLDGQEGKPDTASKSFLRKIRSSLTRSGYWADLLRDVPIFQDDFLAISREHIELKQLLLEVVEEIRPAWPDCVFRLKVDDEVVVLADHHLRSVMRNLLYNAASFSPPDGVVEIRVLQDGEFARIYVDDEGPGVNSDRVEVIFDPYRTTSREKPPTNPRIRQGIGIGLSVARIMTRAYGGDLRCHGNQTAPGGRFEIVLPLALSIEIEGGLSHA